MIATLVLVIIAAMFLVVNGYYRTELDKKPVVREKLKQGDMDYLVDFYIRTDPSLQGRPSYGADNSRISLVTYLDVTSEVSDVFINEVFTQLDEEYIETGMMNYYHKNLITIDDYLERNERFKYSKSLYCLSQKAPESYFDYYFRLFSTPVGEIGQLASEFGIEPAEMQECMENGSDAQIIEDASEVENFGISVNPRMYIGIQGRDSTIIDGIPSIRRINRTIRNYETYLGE